MSTQYTSTSSFCALSTPTQDIYTYTYPTQPSPAHTKPGSLSLIDQRRSLAGRAYMVPIKTNSIPETPPFVYSIADTTCTYRIGSTADLLPTAIPLQSPLSASSTYPSPWHSDRPTPLVLTPSSREMDDNDGVSMDSRYSVVSGVTSVFATRHSIDSSLQILSPSTRAACSEESANEEVVFSGHGVDRTGQLSSRLDDGAETASTMVMEGPHQTFGRLRRARGGVI